MKKNAFSTLLKKIAAFFTSASSNPKMQALKFTLFSLSAGIIQALSFAVFNDLLPLENYELSLFNVITEKAADGEISNVIRNAVFTLNLGNYWVSYLPSLVLSVIWNFTFNRKYTFKPTGHVGRDMLLVAGYYVVFTTATVLLGSWLESIGWHDWIIQGTNMLLNLVTEYLFQKFVVYRDFEKTEPAAKA